MTSTYQYSSHKTNFKHCWNNVERKGTEHKVDASTTHHETMNSVFVTNENEVGAAGTQPTMHYVHSAS